MVKPSKPPQKHATIQDVAARAGVSPSTVSYVLSGKRTISEVTRQRVLQAIEEMNYTASSLGQRMRQGKTHSIGIDSPFLKANDWSLSEFYSSIAAAAGAHQYTAGFFVDRTPQQLVDLAKSRFVDGLLLIHTKASDPRIETLRQTEIPFVLIGRTGDNTDLTYIDFEFEQAHQQAFAHLYELGHRKVAYQRLPDLTPSDVQHWFYIQDSFLQARTGSNLEVVEQVVNPNSKEGFAATHRLLDEHPDVTAIITHNHIETLHALHERHVRVPEECSVVGITTAVAAQWCIPTLSSVDVPVTRMSQIAVDLLMRKVQGEPLTEQILMPAELISRGSTAPPPKR